MASFKTFLKKHDKIRAAYQGLTAAQKIKYKAAWQSGGRKEAKTYMTSITGGDSGGGFSTDQDVLDWLDDKPSVKANFDKLSDAEQQTYIDVFKKKGRAKAKVFLNTSLSIVSADTSTEEVDGVTVPTPTLYPDVTNIPDTDPLVAPDYERVDDITAATAPNVSGIDIPEYDTIEGIDGAKLKRVEGIDTPDFEGAENISGYTAADADYNMVDPMSFASEYGEFYRDEVLKNANLADQIALQQLNTELSGLTDYAKGSAALKREETSIDNAFNQAQRTAQVKQAIPGVVDDIEAQRERANAYAEGRLPDEMEDRMMELNVRSRGADASGAAGFGAKSLAAQKASTLMSAEQRLGVAQMGEQLLAQNMQSREDLYLAPTQYADVGKQINVMPSQSASVLSAAALGQLNELANVSATTALGTQVNQEQFTASLVNDISKFNASIQQDTEKFNANLTERKAEFAANVQIKVDTFNAQMEASENLTEAELQQKKEEFNARMAVDQAQFDASIAKSTSEFNANIAVIQNQFNATIVQRTSEFNANAAIDQNQFDTTINQRVGELNTTMEYNTNVANAGIENAFALGRFDYAVTYKGLIAGLINKDKDTKLMLKIAEMEFGYYMDALQLQQDFEREKFEFAKDEAERIRDEAEKGDPGRDGPPEGEE